MPAIPFLFMIYGDSLFQAKAQIELSMALTV
jgi:hypothetical protein